MQRPALRAAACSLLLLLAAHAPAALADSAPLGPPRPRHGQSPLPWKTTRVAMTAEEVFLTVHPSFTEVRAVFHLRTDDEGERLRVGFPRYADLRRFRVTVDGEEVEAEPVDIGRKDKPEGPLRESPYTRWYAWTMAFEKGVALDLEVSYRFAPTEETFNGVDLPYGRGSTSVCWNGPEEGRNQERLTGYWTAYVLHTGAGWHGPIGRVRVEVRFRDMTPAHLREHRPRKGCRELDDRLVWSFENLEPAYEHDIHLRYNPLLTLDEEIELFEELLRPGVSSRVLEYWWRPYRLVRLLARKGGCEDRIEDVYHDMLARLWPRCPIEAPLLVGPKQFKCLVFTSDRLYGLLARRGKRDACRTLAGRVLPLLDVFATGKAFTRYRNGYESYYDKGDFYVKKAVALARRMRKDAEKEEQEKGTKDEPAD